MKNFLRRFHHLVLGVLCGWDRIRFQGSRRWLAGEMGFKHYLTPISAERNSMTI
jgi:hypothetical protein